MWDTDGADWSRLDTWTNLTAQGRISQEDPQFLTCVPGDFVPSNRFARIDLNDGIFGLEFEKMSDVVSGVKKGPIP